MTKRLIHYTVLAAVAMLLTACALSEEQIHQLSDAFRTTIEASERFTPEQEEILTEAFGDALRQMDSPGGWRGILATIADVGLAMILSYFGISRGARAVKAVRDSKS